mgnify:CR=1 FL=1
MELEKEAGSADNALESTFVYNKKRADGSEKKDLPRKTLELKVRKLNPINTICYVQVISFSLFVLIFGNLTWEFCSSSISQILFDA